jgi:hypothetical protein
MGQPSCVGGTFMLSRHVEGSNNNEKAILDYVLGVRSLTFTARPANANVILLVT